MKKIIFSQKYTHKNIWGKKLLYHLSQNTNLEIEYRPIIPILSTGRRARHNFNTFIIDDIIFVLDDWDHASPTCYLLNNKNNIPKFYLDNPTVVLKIQYCGLEQKNYDAIYNESSIKVIPFTMFSNHTFELESFEWNKNHNHKFLFCLTGKPWRHRSGWFNFVSQHKESLPSFVQNRVSGESSNLEENSQFTTLLKNSRWGLILKGKGCGGKNRREVEFSSLGMPLVLNYQPIYPFEFIPNKDYVLIEKYEDLFKLKDMDPEPFAQRSKEIYNDYFSPNNGLINSFEMAHQTAINLYGNPKPLTWAFINNQNIDNMIKICAKDKVGIGQLNQNQTISFQYVGGSWKSWGARNRGFVNPDNTAGRGASRARLGLYNQTHELICIIPEHTKDNSFVFKAEKNYENLFVGMCDQSVPSWKKRGEVFYKIKILS